MLEFQFKRPPHLNKTNDLLTKYGSRKTGFSSSPFISKIFDKDKDVEKGLPVPVPVPTTKKRKKKLGPVPVESKINDEDEFEVNDNSKKPEDVSQEIWDEQIEDEKRHFHLKIVSGLSLFLSIIMNLSFVKTVIQYSLEWVYLIFYIMCSLDIIGCFSGIISLVPKYTMGGWRICNWFLNHWNRNRIAAYRKKKAKAKAAKAKAKKEKKKVKEIQSKTKDEISIINEKSTTTTSSTNPSTQKQKQDLQPTISKAVVPVSVPPVQLVPTQSGDKVKTSVKGNNQKVKGKQPNRPKIKLLDENKKKNKKGPKGCFWKGKFRPCTICTTGITYITIGLSERMAVMSCLCLHISGFINLISTGFHKYMLDLRGNFYHEVTGCETVPSDVCSDFKQIFTSLFTFIWIMIVSRTIAIFMIGWYTDEKQLDYLRPLESDKLPKELLVSENEMTDDLESDKDKKKHKKHMKKKKRGSDDSDSSDFDSNSSSSSSSSGDDYNIKDALKTYIKEHKGELPILQQANTDAGRKSMIHRGTLNF